MQPFVKVRNWVDSGLLPGQPLDHNWKPWELAETDHNRDTGDSWSSKENAPFANPLHYLVITCSFEDVQYHERFDRQGACGSFAPRHDQFQGQLAVDVLECFDAGWNGLQAN